MENLKISNRKNQYYQKLNEQIKWFSKEYIELLMDFHPQIPDEFFDFSDEPTCVYTLHTFSELTNPNNSFIPIICQQKSQQDNKKPHFSVYDLPSFMEYCFNQFYKKHQKIMLEEKQQEIDGQSFFFCGIFIMSCQIFSPYDDLLAIDKQFLQQQAIVQQLQIENVFQKFPTKETIDMDFILEWVIHYVSHHLKQQSIEQNIISVKRLITKNNHYINVFQRIQYQLPENQEQKFVEKANKFYKQVELEIQIDNFENIFKIQMENLKKSDILKVEIEKFFDKLHKEQAIEQEKLYQEMKNLQFNSQQQLQQQTNKVTVNKVEEIFCIDCQQNGLNVKTTNEVGLCDQCIAQLMQNQN